MRCMGLEGKGPSPSSWQFCIDVVHTLVQNAGMSKLRATASSEGSRNKAPGRDDRPLSAAPVPPTKGSINLRMDGVTRQLIDDAAALQGKTRTEFMVESARQQALDVLLDQRLFALEPERHDAFMAALDNPPVPGPKLKALLRRVPAWQK